MLTVYRPCGWDNNKVFCFGTLVEPQLSNFISGIHLRSPNYLISFLAPVCGVPIIWKSKLQTEITLSTMEAEYVALSMAMKELLPVRELIIEVCESVGLSRNDLTSIHSTVWEDNAGCAILANMELPRMTPRSKHYAVKYHWFRSKLKPNNIKVEKIDGTFQLADIFTKALRTDKFERLRKLLMGW